MHKGMQPNHLGGCCSQRTSPKVEPGGFPPLSDAGRALSMTSNHTDLGSQAQIGNLAAGSNVSIITYPVTTSILGQYTNLAIVNGTYKDDSGALAHPSGQDPTNCFFSVPGTPFSWSAAPRGLLSLRNAPHTAAD